jgi:glycosyltransferase involved in cell wall biosynthesis
MSDPLISIGMPVFNNAATLRESILSIILQSYTNWELLIMDDGSTDESMEIASTFEDSRIKIIADGENRGLAARMNQAISMSRGEFFARMDADDIAYPQRLFMQQAYMQEHPEVGLLGCGSLVFSRDGVSFGIRIYPETHEGICTRPWFGILLMHPTWMGTMDWFRKSTYNEKLKKAQDQELLLRTFSRSNFANIPQILMAYREDQAGLKKTLLSRCYVMRALFYSGSAKIAILGVITQAFKMLIDLAFSVVGQRARLIQRRSKLAPDAAIGEWEKVLHDVQQSGVIITTTTDEK